jgi:peptidoglycan-N-acetylglucosamine deacetylase
VAMKTFGWPESKRCAVSLTFDDARLSQLEVGVPLLTAAGLRATFFVLPTAVMPRLEDWQAAAGRGHEIGNHTLTHPCSGNYRFSRENALEEYTLERIADEIDGAQSALNAMFGAAPKSFAYPCGETFVGRGETCASFVPLVAKTFVVGRGAKSEDHNDPAFCDLAQTLSMRMDGASMEWLIERINLCEREGGWLILTGHEVGTNDGYGIATETLRGLCAELKKRESVWVDTVGTVGEYILQRRD